ncbi:MAG: hypothetical protein Q9M23_04135, partial [Mariprofundaceae bacterium]|nr:hypothetical protein [Mariprofundaceae bacterium]
TRLSIELIEDAAMQGAPDTAALLSKALPILWDRIIPLAHRARAAALKSNSRLVARIIPGRDSTLVEFQGERVFDTLREAHIPAIIAAPRFHLLISVQNVLGQEMQQTSQLLAEEAARLAALHGIELSDSGAGLVLSWRWLDALHAELSVRGQTRLTEYVETREITDADSLPALQAWLDETLLKARDAYAFEAEAESGAVEDGSRIDPSLIEISVQRDARLLEQVALEDSLGRDPRVRSLQPTTLSSSMQRYALRLQGNDASWLAEWFARRGYRLDRLSDGSLVAQ